MWMPSRRSSCGSWRPELSMSSASLAPSPWTQPNAVHGSAHLRWRRPAHCSAHRLRAQRQSPAGAHRGRAPAQHPAARARRQLGSARSHAFVEGAPAPRRQLTLIDLTEQPRGQPCACAIKAYALSMAASAWSSVIDHSGDPATRSRAAPHHEARLPRRVREAAGPCWVEGAGGRSSIIVTRQR
jgi:hypothetical protein